MTESQAYLFSQAEHPRSPKELSIRVISPEEASDLNRVWHSRLPIIPVSNIYRNKNQVCFGASFGVNWYTVAIFTDPVARCLNNKGDILELRRLAISPNAPHNTASWMIAGMIKYIKKNLPSINRLVSYQDTEVHTGTIYKASNWQPTTVTRGSDWNISRNRNPSQTTADKVRWEYSIMH